MTVRQWMLTPSAHDVGPGACAWPNRDWPRHPVQDSPMASCGWGRRVVAGPSCAEGTARAVRAARDSSRMRKAMASARSEDLLAERGEDQLDAEHRGHVA